MLNQMAGTAFTLMTDDKSEAVLACGGVRSAGIGQMWASFDPDALKDFPKLILRTSKDVINECIIRENIYKLYADASVNKPAWFKHLGFRLCDNVYVR